jgi:hypothetical protein
MVTVTEKVAPAEPDENLAFTQVKDVMLALVTIQAVPS